MTPERLDACPHDRWKGAPDVISQAICSRCSWSATDLVAAYHDRVRELEARAAQYEQALRETQKRLASIADSDGDDTRERGA